MNLSGVGEKTERKLKKIGILKAEDFLQYYPNHYEYFPYRKCKIIRRIVLP